MTVEASNLFQGLDERERLLLLASMQEEIERRHRERKIDFFAPNKFQREFIEAGRNFRYRFLSGGVQTGKSLVAGFETAYHMRGEYPPDWRGRVFEKPTRGLVVGIDLEQLRGAAQRTLLGEDQTSWGTGTIPKDWLVLPPELRKDGNNFVDYFHVKHVSGELSTAYLVTQNMKHTKFQGRGFDWIWGDESITEMAMFNQFLSRITATDGSIYLTANPEEMGYTEVYAYFDPDNPERPPGAWYREGSLREVTHLSRERIQEIIDSYPAHVRPYKVDGKPVFGKGLVYPVTEEFLKTAPFDVNNPRLPFYYWPRIAGIDFGWSTSLTAIVWLIQDPRSGVWYVYDVYATSGTEPKDVVPHIKLRDRAAGFDIPVAWPKDGLQSERSTGNVIAEMYKELGVNMLDDFASFVDDRGRKTDSVEGGVMKVLQLMQTGKFKIFYQPQPCKLIELPDPFFEPFFQELRAYVRGEDNKIKKNPRSDPHRWDAVRYAIVMGEHARSCPDRKGGIRVAPVASSFSAFMN